MNGNGDGDGIGEGGTGTTGGAREGEVLWAARTASPGLHALAAVAGAVALVAVALTVGGTTAPCGRWRSRSPSSP